MLLPDKTRWRAGFSPRALCLPLVIYKKGIESGEVLYSCFILYFLMF